MRRLLDNAIYGFSVGLGFWLAQRVLTWLLELIAHAAHAAAR
jgi:hypothetical protein